MSTDKQTVENQRFEINNFCEKQNIVIDRWLEETISGTKDVEKRQLGRLLKKLKKDDILICAELSRLGRNLMMIMSILHYCMKNDVKVWTIKDNFRLGNDINSQVLAFAFGLSAQIERDLISMRTREALARKRAEGVVLGRPKGAKSKSVKLTGSEAQIKALLDKGISYSAIGRIIGVHRLTVSNFVKSRKEQINESHSVGIEDLDAKTKRQVNTLLKNKDEVEALLKRRGSIGAISSLFDVQPYAVNIFKRVLEDKKMEDILNGI